MNENKINQRRSDIIEAAIQVFSEKGYHATKISDIAELLKIGHGTFYRYFKSKFDIFNAIADDLILHVGQMVTTEAPTESNSLEDYRAQLNRIGKSLFDIFMTDIRIFRIAFYELLGVDATLNEKLENAIKLFDLYTEQYLINGVNKCFLRPDLDTEVIAKAVNGMIFVSCKAVLDAEDKDAAYQRWMNSVSLLMLDGMALRA
ncbi:MAG: TetR/AcrR family transcriptional regulator [Proteobacteria bacterium]|nr:TetR/AcrR family transcriptional regulator [Pseudomonadota bacterium]